MNNSFLSVIVALFFSTTISAQIFSDDFGTIGGGQSSTSVVLTDQCFDGNTSDYFGVVVESEIGEIFIDADGAFLAAQDMDAGPCTTGTGAANWSNINISGQTGLVLCLDIAEGDDGTNQDWDVESQVIIAASVDGAAQTLGTITAQGAINTFPGFDCTGDGVGDGFEITNIFTTFCFSISATGNSLDVNISINGLEAGDEDVAFDNMAIYSNSNPTSTVLNEACGGIPGCTDASACNYNANATVNNGTCFSIGELCDDGDASTTGDLVTSACICEGTSTGFTNCTTPTWEVISPLTNENAFNNNGEWTAITNGFSANGFCGGGCAEPVSTWLVYGPLNLSNTSALNLVFDAAKNFDQTDLVIAYTNDYSSACPTSASWTTAATISAAGAVDVDLSTAQGTQVYIGIEYNDDGADGYADWDLTNFQLLADVCPTVGTPVTSACSTVTGCTTATACNYDAAANFDDGSCFSVGDACDDADALTDNDVWVSCTTCQGTNTGLVNCNAPIWEVVSPTPNVNAFNNFGQWTAITDGFSANGYCGSDCIEPVSTWLVYGPLNVSNTSSLNLIFNAAENFDITDLNVAYTSNYSAACPADVSWTVAATITNTGLVNVDLSNASGTAIYIGIDYTDDGTDSYSDWDLTNFQLLADVCPTVGSPIVSNCGTGIGCTDAAACNYDANASIDDGSCVNVGDICDDGDTLTINDVFVNCNTCQGEPVNPTLCPASAKINEFHYDNDGIDANEFVEIALPVGADPTQVQIDLYNGGDGTSYNSTLLSAANLVSTNGVFDFYVWYPLNIQNGPDGIAVSCIGGAVYQFITYEGAFMASDGPFAGEMGIDVGVTETSTTNNEQSIMCDGFGNFLPTCTADPGATNNLFSCGAIDGCLDMNACNYNSSATNDDGSCFYIGNTCDDGIVTTVNDEVNSNCDCIGTPVGGGTCPASVLINEFHYDNAGVDLNQFVEIALPAGSDETQVRVDLYNGNNGASYAAVILSASNFVSTSNGFDYYVWNPLIMENGPDGIAVSCLDGTLFDFITYEGTFMASDGPFAGEMGIDIGVEESSDMTDGQSIMNDGAGNYIVYCAADAGSANDISSCACDPIINNNCFSTCTQTINLNPGWNLISLDVSPADKTILSVFGDLQAGNLEFIAGFDNGTLTFDPNRPPFLNTLAQVADGFGYWVKVINADVLTVEGDCLDDNFRKPFDAGWNLIAFPPDAPQAPATYFADLISIGDIEFIAGFDNGTLTFDPNRPPFLNTLQQMENGFGYWVKVTNASN